MPISNSTWVNPTKILNGILIGSTFGNNWPIRRKHRRHQKMIKFGTMSLLMPANEQIEHWLLKTNKITEKYGLFWFCKKEGFIEVRTHVFGVKGTCKLGLRSLDQSACPWGFNNILQFLFKSHWFLRIFHILNIWPWAYIWSRQKLGRRIDKE